MVLEDIDHCRLGKDVKVDSQTEGPGKGNSQSYPTRRVSFQTIPRNRPSSPLSHRPALSLTGLVSTPKVEGLSSETLRWTTTSLVGVPETLEPDPSTLSVPRGLPVSFVLHTYIYICSR